MQQFESQFRLQQYIMRMIVQGSHYWTGGIIPPEKLAGLSQKFAGKYGTELSQSVRYRKRKQGLAVSRFLVAPLPDGKYMWFLLVSEGVGIVTTEESLRDARLSSERVIWNGEYILLRKVRPSYKGGGQHWSWWLLSHREQEISSELDLLAKAGDPGLKSYIEALKARPLHSGIRSQLWKAYRRAHRILQACHPEMPWPGPSMDIPLPWVSKFASTRESKGREEVRNCSE